MLTERKKAFADAVLAGKSQKDAAIAAGLSERTAKQAGCRLGKDKDVVAYLKKVRKGGKTGEYGGYSPTGVKTPDAPPDWPFGTVPPAALAPAAAPAEAPKRQTAEEFLRDLVNDTTAEPKLRLDAAKKLIEFEKAKPAPQGKKEGKLEEAKKLSRFTPAAPPRLAAANGKKV